MNDDKLLKAIEGLQADVASIKREVSKIPTIEKQMDEQAKTLRQQDEKLDEQGEMLREQGKKLDQQGNILTQHGKLLGGLAANMATFLEEQQAQRSDIRSLHTEMHESREELKGEIIAARVEARTDSIDLKAEVTKPIKDYGKRINALEDAADIPHPDKN
jgi:hypothetical protein